MTVAWSAADVPNLEGRTVVVTGANAGLGLEITKVLAGNGARVLMACRNRSKADMAAQKLNSYGLMGRAEVRIVDLASLSSIDKFCSLLVEEEKAIHLLVNNAGLMAVDESRTADGFEMQFGVNHLGHFALTAGLMPVLARTPGSRVVSMSSMGHRAGRMDFEDPMYERHPYRRWPAYFQSKLANLLFTLELDRRLRGGSSVQALAAHPGASRTELGHEGTSVANRALRTLVPFTTQSAHAGALPAVRAATDPQAVGGEYYGPKFMYFGAAVTETPSRRARNVDDARRLWELSVRLTGRDIMTEMPSGRP